jgi:hypothetical protein
LVGDKTRYNNRLGNALKQYYPQALEWFEQRDTVLFCDFIYRWPKLTQAKGARKTTLVTFFCAASAEVTRNYLSPVFLTPPGCLVRESEFFFFCNFIIMYNIYFRL